MRRPLVAVKRAHQGCWGDTCVRDRERVCARTCACDTHHVGLGGIAYLKQKLRHPHELVGLNVVRGVREILMPDTVARRGGASAGTGEYDKNQTDRLDRDRIKHGGIHESY